MEAGEIIPADPNGTGITADTAASLLRSDVKAAETAIRNMVSVPLSQSEFNALTDFTFNVGAGAFARSGVLRLLNGGNYGGSAKALLRWNKITVDGIKIFDPGLEQRRILERNLFLNGN